jgi:hypothetical protein
MRYCRVVAKTGSRIECIGLAVISFALAYLIGPGVAVSVSPSEVEAPSKRVPSESLLGGWTSSRPTSTHPWWNPAQSPSLP